jgi:uncharacterized repeat protein (TIGR01451 family)
VKGYAMPVNLQLLIDDNQPTAVPGASVVYLVTVNNFGDAVDASLSVPLPAGATSAFWSFGIGTDGALVTGPLLGNGALATTVALPAPTIAAAAVIFTFTVHVDPSATGALITTGTLTPTLATIATAVDVDTLTPQAGLSVTVSDGKTTVVPGTSDTYTITVSNSGPSTLSSLSLADSIPAALLNPIFGAPSAGSYDPLLRVWSGLSLATGQSASITLTGTIDPTATGSLANTVTIAPSSGTTDTNPANNIASDVDTLTPQADLSVALTDGRTTVVPGTSDTYTITVGNNGPSTVSSLVLTDTIPAALLNPIFGAPSAGNYDSLTGVWSGLSLATGQTTSLTLTGTIDHAIGSVTNTVTVAPPPGVTDPNPANNTASDTNTLTPSGTNPSPPPGTSANMILRGADGIYVIYDIGNNVILAAYPLAQVATAWQLAGFNAGNTSNMTLRNSTNGAFQIYHVSNNNITGSAALGAVGLNWQVAGFGNFSGLGETDMMLRDANTGAFQVYDIANNQITGTAFVGTVGLDWQVGGFGNFSSRGTSDMILRNTNTGGLQVYDIANNQITGSAFLGTVGLDWQVAGFGAFSSRPGETDMIMRNSTTGALQVYDIANNQIVGAASLGQVGLEWQFAGIAPIHAPGASDLVLRNVNTGAFEVYDIANNQITGAASLGQVGLEWQLGGFAAAPAAASGSLGSTAQLVQAMAGLAGGGAADGLSIAPLGADASQQNFLTQPHA